MPREPIIIGLDDSPIVIQAKGVDWSFNPDPPPAFLIRMMEVAQSLQDGELSQYDTLETLLVDQLVPKTQRTRWAKAGMGVANTNAILAAYVAEVNNLPTPPPSQSGTPRGGAGRK